MSKKWLVVSSGIFLLSTVLFAENIPQPTGWVNDFANVISSEYRDKLTSLISELEEKTSSEIAVVTVESIAPYDEKEYARMLFDNWKPGKKGKDNGALVLLTIKERRWRIETGYGIEGILPDGLCGEIGRNYMVPYFKDGKYGEGLYYGVLRIHQIISKDINVETKGPSVDFMLFLLPGILFILVISYAISVGRSHYDGSGYYGGSGFGGGGFSGGGFGGFGGGGGGGGGAGGGF